MDWAEISRLAALLREHGDKVLNEVCKFTLSTKLLDDLNHSFSMLTEQRDAMSSSFSIRSNSNVNIEIFRDVQFLNDFLERTVSLKLVHNLNSLTVTENADLKKLKNLKLLELNKVQCKDVQGIQCLRAQLQYLVCIRSVTEVSEVLEKCGADLSQGLIWNELKEAVFNHNDLESIDNSFEFAPWLHTLDLSHNEIQDIRPLNCLYNLKHLNLGYNKLTSIPTFTGQICNRLQVLIICNNFIEDITGLIVLINIRELDLSDNCILQHNLLTPLANLATLQWLNLQGNPISYHFEHRTLTSYNLHRNTATVRFLLDRQFLSKNELKHVGSLHPIQAKMPALSTSCSSSSVNTTLVERTRRTRQATISDDLERPTIEDSLASVSSLITSSEHIETRRQIEELREKFGSTWLYKEGGSMVQDVLGMPKSSYPITSSPYEADFLIHAKEVLEARVTIAKSKSSDKLEQAEVVIEKSNNSTETEDKCDSNNVSVNDPVTETSNQTTTYESATDQLSADEDDCPYPDENADISSSESMFDLGKGDDSIFIVTIRGQENPIFLIVTEKFMAERDAIVNAKEKSKWDTERLVACELMDDDPPYVQLEFDTLRSDRKLRQYVLDDTDEMQRLIGILRVIIGKRPPEKLICYKCMKCSSSFGIEKPNRVYETQDVECPSCLSTLVIEEK